jgi:hypothetical protein
MSESADPRQSERDESGSPHSIDRLHRDLSDGYQALVASLQAANDVVPTRRRWFEFEFPERTRKYGEELAADPARAKAIQEAYVAGAVLAFADELAKYEDNDRSPQFEFVRHLRNAISHGNHFVLTKKACKRLEAHPAFLFRANGSLSHKIKPKLDGKKCLGKFIDIPSVFEGFDAANLRIQEIELGMERNEPLSHAEFVARTNSICAVRETHDKK